MKSSSSFFALVLFVAFFTSCKTNHKEQATDYFKENNGPATNYLENTMETAQKNLRYFNVMDSQNGMVMYRIPLPAQWEKGNNKKYSFIGPNGIKVYSEKSGSYIFSNDPQTNQMYQQNGVDIQFPKPIDQVINERFVSYANKINRKLLRQYPLPQIASYDKNFDDQLYKTVPARKTFTAKGLEWQDPDGTMFLTVLHHFVSYDQYGGYWGVIYTILESPEKDFEQAKRQYLNGLLNQQINPNWIQAINQRDMQVAYQSNAAHQKRMAAIKAFGDQNTANYNTRMAAMDQNMESWRARQASSDKGQEQFIDYINDNTNVSNTQTGQTYKVESGANQYWMNNNNEYIKSDNSLYDPNLDPNINNQTWTEYKEQQ